MLLIGDIHINSRYKDSIIENIRNYIYQNQDEQNIVFLGDYVYHFNYDRKALLELFNLFVELFEQGKNVYVLAGNHDWIAESFVFEEGQKSFDILNQKSDNKLYFITKPFFENIEGKDILFFPFNTSIEAQEVENQNLKLNEEINYLQNSNNKNENISGNINSNLLNSIQNSNSEELLVIHHYYFTGVEFPGQKGRFNFKDIALSNSFLEEFSNVYFISGHLHKPFGYKNYFCTGSVWNTSSLELDEFKFLRKADLKNLSIQPTNIYVNPFVSFQLDSEQKAISDEDLNNRFGEVIEENLSNFQGSFDIKAEEMDYPSTSVVSLIIKSDELEYDHIYEIFSKEVFNSLKDLKIKKTPIKMGEVMNLLEEGQKDLHSSFSNRQSLLKNYLQQKFLEDSDKYVEKLKELKII